MDLFACISIVTKYTDMTSLLIGPKCEQTTSSPPLQQAIWSKQDFKGSQKTSQKTRVSVTFKSSCFDFFGDQFHKGTEEINLTKHVQIKTLLNINSFLELL